MEEIMRNVTDINIDIEMREAYLQYSMSVIVGRALPDVRDGLKPVHRRVLYAMSELSNYHNKPYKKSARVVGDVIGKYHPHGDTAVYDTIVRMAQDFSLRFPLIDGQGNFGSIDGDVPAAQRYTEVRMTRLAEELLNDIDKETISWSYNYDDSLLIPDVLPSKFPNLLVNGASGIAVGMATNIPPHNLGEVVDGVIALIKDPQISIDRLIKLIPGPDFPTAAVVSGVQGLHSAYKNGRGIITLKAVSEIVSNKDKDSIVITEIPYQVNKSRLIESIATLVRDKKIEGISDIRDESSREGMRIVIALKRNENAQVVLNRLYKFTQMQTSFGIILLALDKKKQPITFNLKEMLQSFVDHRKDVVTRRCIFELKKSESRFHILEGLKRALDQIEQVIATIRGSKEAYVALNNLMDRFKFTEKQAKAILEMRLQRLTSLEREKITDELEEIEKKIKRLKVVLSDVREVFKIIVEELNEIKRKFNNSRRTKIESGGSNFQDEDLIPKEDVIVSLTHSGYIKRISTDEYRIQKRGGKGLKGAGARKEDFVWKIFAVDTHTTLLIFSDRGRMYWQKVYRLPQGSRTSKGRSIVNVIKLSSGENIRAILPVEEFNQECYTVMVTGKGIIKKTSLSEFSRPRSSGIIALTIELDDNLMQSKICRQQSDILIVTKQGMSIRFEEKDIRPMSRKARGVKGIRLESNDQVVEMEVVPKNCPDTILIVTSGGYGKRTLLEEYRVQNRGGVGIITQKITDKVGHVVGAAKVKEKDQIMVTTDQGQVIRMSCSDISIVGRNTQGVRLINLKDGEHVTGAALIASEDNEY